MTRFTVVPMIMLGCLLMFNLGCEPENQITDPRDGQTYITVTIGSQTWMAENLNFHAGDSSCYDDNPPNCEIYGRLYDWETAKSACPPGWHLPSDAEWGILIAYLGDNAGGKMKLTEYWDPPNTGATNESGFSGLPGGIRYHIGRFDFLGSFGFWWSSSDHGTDDAWYQAIWSGSGGVDMQTIEKGIGCSVRCLRD